MAKIMTSKCSNVDFFLNIGVAFGRCCIWYLTRWKYNYCKCILYPSI